MEELIKGDVVVVPFPFSDLSDKKRRPAFVVKKLEGEDIILCQITSRARNDAYSIPVEKTDFSEGGLPVDSYIRPNRLFTADRGIIIKKAGKLNEGKINAVITKLIEIIS
jgi:mRNA interferase MazF